MSKKEKYALKTLSKRGDIIITKAAKGGAVVIIESQRSQTTIRQHHIL